MAYRIDFTESRYAWRRACVIALVSLVLAAVAALGWGGLRIYRQWERPTLGQKLQALHDLSAGIEPLYAKWQACAVAFQAVAPFYRLYWSTNAVDMLARLAERSALLSRNLMPVRWELRTGGACKLTYSLHLDPQEKREQVVNACEALALMTRPVEAQTAWKDQPLATVRDVEITVTFSLDAAAYDALPPPPPLLKDAIDRIESTRNAVSSHSLNGTRANMRMVKTELNQILQQALAGEADRLDEWRQRLAASVDPSSFLRDLERDLRSRDAAVPPELVALREEWHQLASRRLPWRRLKTLDTPELEANTELLAALAASAPSPALFDSIQERVRILRDALRSGYRKAAVFDEGELHRRLEDECSLSGLTVQPGTAHDGIIVASWALPIRSSKDAHGSASQIELSWVVGVLERIRAMQAGFVVERIVTQFPDQSQGAITVLDASASGVLAVCDGQAESNGADVDERGQNVGR